MKRLVHKGFLPAPDGLDPLAAGPVEARDEGAWRVLPLEGAFELSYSDAAGKPSLRRVIAHELKIGPGKTLLGGVDLVTEAYRGFRADRIHVLEDAATGEIIDRNILDWLLARAERQERVRRRAEAAMRRAHSPLRQARVDEVAD